jgi:hypothetical protein
VVELASNGADDAGGDAAGGHEPAAFDQVDDGGGVARLCDERWCTRLDRNATLDQQTLTMLR